MSSTHAGLLAAAPGEAEPLARGSVLWRSWNGEQRLTLNAAEHAVLQICMRFAPRDRHLGHLAQSLRISPNQAAVLFDSLRARDLIVDATRLIGPASASVAAVPEPLLVIRSYQRPAGLKRLLDSLLADERRFDVHRRHVIVDDTLDADHAAATRELAVAFARASGSEVALLGPDHRDSALNSLLDGFNAEEKSAALRALDPAHPTAVTGSRTWNWAVLLSAGGTLSILDDDTEFPLRTATTAVPTIDLLESIEPVTEFFDDHGYRALPPVAQEPYAHLREWLGQPARALLGRHGYTDFPLAGHSARELLLLHDNARVVGVVPGVYGGIAFNSSAYLAYSYAESQRSLWRAPYRHERLEADRVWCGFLAPRLVSFAVYTPLLLDNRELLPFAGTWGRADDTYFLMLLRAIGGAMAFAHVPASLGHVDLEPRHRLQRALQPLLLDRNAFMAHWFGQIAERLSGSDRRNRFAAVGELCRNLGSASDRELADQVLRYRGGMMTRLASHLDGALGAHPDAPAQWRDWVTQVARVNREAALAETLSDDDLRAYRAALQQVVDLAPVWPRLWDRARELMGADSASLVERV